MRYRTVDAHAIERRKRDQDSEQMPPSPNRKIKTRSKRPFIQSGVTETIVSQWLEQAPALDPVMLSITASVTRLSILNDKIFEDVSREVGVSSGGLKLLYALRRVGPPYVQRPTDLYQLLAITSGAVTYTINLLARQGLVEMTDDPEDGRSRLVGLTQRGLAVANAATSRSIAIMARLEEDMTPQDRLDTIECLMRLARCWEKLADSPPFE